MLSAVAVVAALVAMLAFAPFASATSDPVASGTTTVKLNKGFVKKLKNSGVKVLKLSPAGVKGSTVTLPVSGGSLDPVSGLGTVEHSGGIKFKAGKKSASVNTLVLDTTTGSLNAKVAGKSMKFALVKGFTVARNGFGANVSVSSLKLTGKAAKQLNKKLGFSGKKKSKGKAKGHKRAAASKAVQPPFKGNQVLGSSTSETQPKTVAVLPTGNASLALSASALQKLNDIGPHEPGKPGPFSVKLATIAPTRIVSAGPPPTVAFPIAGGTISPTASSGVVQTSGGLELVQSLEAAPPPGTKGVTVLKMGNIWVDLGAKTATVEVTITNEKTAELNKGSLGRASIADINLTGATITSDAATHTVSVQNASATLQAVTAEVLNSVFVEPIEGKGKGTFAGGDPLGVFSFTAQTE
ncbi:MAG TPA: HtaA domain-containing protein [Solirubrobacterales bacterium]|jgi:hypothetical protein|nr:HtaA domain-containing protein [Solirubrobacterales bacterium]